MHPLRPPRAMLVLLAVQTGSGELDVSWWMIVQGVPGLMVLWLFVIALVAAIGGWGRLASVHPGGPDPVDEGAFRFCSVAIRAGFLPADYPRCLRVRPGAEGIRLSAMLLFRFMHPPLLIPWSAVRDCRQGGVFWKYTEVTLNAPAVRIRFPGPPGAAVHEQWMRMRPEPAPRPALVNRGAARA